MYDATTAFKAKSEMTRLPAADLKPRDLVLVEADVQRFKTGDKKQSGWQTWRAFYGLKSVCLLHEAEPEEEKDTFEGSI